MYFRERAAKNKNGKSALEHSSGEMTDRILNFDWSTTPLGPVEHWPQSLRTVVNILLSSRYAMWMGWGGELTMLYNDAYQPTLGIKHPGALGARARDVWAEIWSDIGPRVETVLTKGTSTYDEGLLLFLERSGVPEETYHTFSYSPLANDEGQISGMLCVVTEETDRLIGERRVETLRHVASALASAKAEDQVLRALEEQLSRNKKDLPFTLLYFFEPDGSARLVSASGIASENSPLAPERIAPGADAPWPAHHILAHPVPVLIDQNTESRKLTPLPAGDWNKPAVLATVVPIKQQGQEQPAGFFVVGINPYRPFDSAYSGFVDLLSGQIAAGVGNARAYEAERRRAEALAEIDRAKTTFFSNVSHELRTPLTLMLSPVEELLGKSASARDPDDRDLLNLVHRNGLRLQKLVNTLLDFSRIEAGRMQAVYQPTDLAQYTADLAANFRSAMERAGLEFRVDCQPLPEQVYVDREMWEKIVLNLLSNALKFTFEGGVTIALRPSGNHAQLSVRDTGTGIPAAELPHIFERFHRVAGAQGRTIEGTGIGLALVQELAKLHAGSITVESELNRGTEFIVTIPLGSEHLPKDKVRDWGEPASAEPSSDTFVTEALRWLSYADPEFPANEGDVTAAERILLADDNADMREYVTRLLGGRYRVVAVSNGEEALTAALSEPPDLILSDVMMPRLDGFGLLKALRARPETRTIPVVLLSARAGEESRVDGLGAGADDYLVKPFTAGELLARVAAHLSMHKRRAEAEQALRTSQNTLQSFYDSSPFLMGVIEIDGEDIVAIYCNSAVADFFGSDVAALPHQTGRELGIPKEIDALWVKHYRQSQAESRSITFAYQHPLPGGARWLSASVNFLGYGTCGRPRYSFVAEDITARKKSEELLERSNEHLRRANADLEQFAYSASHDLQEPLRMVAIYSQLLQKKYEGRLDEQADMIIRQCVDGAVRMEELIKDLLAYTHASAESIAAPPLVSLNDAFDQSLENLRASIDETHAYITHACLPSLRIEPVHARQIFQNLVENALKYRSNRPPVIQVAARRDADLWIISVSDNGIGIDPNYKDQIFGLFKRLHTRNRYSGTGIGLAICKKLVERYRGRIWVESKVDVGSTFLFSLPAETESNS